MSPIAYVLTKLLTPKSLVRQMFKKSRFRKPYEKWHGKWCQTLLKSYECLLTHWLPMTKILFSIVAIYSNQFRYSFLWIEKAFSDLLSPFLNSRLDYRLTKMLTPKCVVKQISKKFRFGRVHQSDMVNCPKHSWNLQDSTFTIFIDQCERN